MGIEYIIVLVTAANRKEAEAISQDLLVKKLIACANIVGPVSSHFHWSGKVEQAEEFLVLMKSRGDMFEEIADAVGKMHSYKVPEVLALPIIAGSASYLSWLGRSLAK